MYVRAQALPEWWVQTEIRGVQITPAGHETLTTQAARGLNLEQSELTALLEGVRRPDTASKKAHLMPGEQRRHVLRRTRFQSTRSALTDATAHLRHLYGRIRKAGADPAEQFHLIGEALHLIQDSYSPAHAERDPRTGRIVYIRNFGLLNLVRPEVPGREHGVPIDLRDHILTPTGGLKLWAQHAVTASGEYLEMVLRHITVPKLEASHIQELHAFIRRHLSM
jgi:hypothetical protein